MSALQQVMLSLEEDHIDINTIFSSYQYEGNGNRQTLDNGLALGLSGGLNCIKDIDVSISHALFDSERLGASDNAFGASLDISTSGSENTYSSTTKLVMPASGFTVPTPLSNSHNNYISWSFLRASKFFDVVAYTGTNSLSTIISHGLDGIPGLILVRRINSKSNWGVTVIDGVNIYGLSLNTTAEGVPGTFEVTAFTSSVFKPGYLIDSDLNKFNNSTGEYIAYLFANDTSANGVIRSGIYSGNSSLTGPVITLGWKPQFLLIKNMDSASNWLIYDNTMDAVNSRTVTLSPDVTSGVNPSAPLMDFLTTGFQPKATSYVINNSGDNYLYLAIRAPA